jgi:hypothetical protein
MSGAPGTPQWWYVFLGFGELAGLGAATVRWHRKQAGTMRMAGIAQVQLGRPPVQPAPAVQKALRLPWGVVTVLGCETRAIPRAT